ncbi:diguanylate cyclase [Ectothiorhodospiraceae bacterium WFHF3C12]|nr:diguanylate cyclase [Ectothiorhodospiraceae bacterium WFHF3C12]
MKGLRRVRSPSWRAGQVALVYASIAALWIGFSDALVEAWVDDPQALTRVQMVKGWLFVAVTAGVLFVSLQRLLAADSRLLARFESQRRELRELSQFREGIIDNASIWINVIDPHARVVVWNKAAEQISGYRREDVLGTTRIWELLYPDPDYRDFITRTAAEIIADGVEVTEFETFIRTKGGESRSIAWNSRRFFGDDGEIVGSVAIGRDITDRKQAEAALRAREQQLANLMANMPGMAYRCVNDPEWTMEFVSSGCLELTGYPPEALVNNREIGYASLVHPDDRERLWDQTQAAVREGRPYAHEYRLRTRSEEEIWVWEQGRAVADSGGRVLEGIIMNITDRKNLEQELSSLARCDPLTGLANRREFYKLLVDELERAQRYDRPLALLWLDLDDFKQVNDRLGHLAGDEVLRRLAHLLADSVRTADRVARIGGEEFVVLLPEMGLEEASETAERLRRLVGETRFELDGGDAVSTTVSVGVAVYPVHGASVDDLAGAADQAMYDAKRAGRDRVRQSGEALQGA